MRRILFALFIVTFLIAGCAPAASPNITPASSWVPSLIPSSTPSPDPQPTETSSPTASSTNTALPTNTAVFSPSTHKWQPNPVLIKLDSWGGDGCCLYSYPADFVLYADGRIILRESFDKDGEWRQRLLTKMYSRKEMCSVLNTLDRTRFLDYNLNEYRPQDSEYFSIDGSGTITIDVNVWKSKSGRFYALDGYVQLYDALTPVPDLTGFPPISPALRDLFYFLDLYPSTGLEIYRPEKLGLVVTKSNSAVINPDSPVVNWPLTEFSLAEIEKTTSANGYPSEYFVVEGGSARSIYSYFENSFGFYGENVRQNGQEYVVFVRPILPYEILQIEKESILPDPDVKLPEFELECSADDGFLSIPTLSVPTP